MADITVAGELARMTALFQARSIAAVMGAASTTSNPRKTAENNVIFRISAPLLQDTAS
jgi:hypothetical protein